MRKLCVLSVVVLLLCTSCSKERYVEYSQTELMLGTVCRITIVSEVDSQDVLESAFAAIAEVENTISRTKASSELSLVNQNAGIRPMAVSLETYELIKTALALADLTDGAFNPAIGPLVSLWGINTEAAKVPSEAEILSVLPLLDWRLVQLEDDSQSVFLPVEGMALDLGGIGKGYAADVVDDILRSHGVKHALVNLGGNILVIGGKNEENPWRIGLQDPTSERGSYYLTYDIKDGSVVTSGPYERYFEQEGRVYHHILDSATGYPADTHITSMTVIGPDSTVLDALSTASFVLGVERSLALIEAIANVEAIILTDGGQVFMTRALAEAPSMWRFTGNEYRLTI